MSSADGKRWRRVALGAAGGLGAAVLVAALGWQVAVRARPFPRELLTRAPAESPLVLDTRGQVLWQGATAFGGRQVWVPLAGVSPHVVAATLAGEDHRFWEHAGVDFRAVARALLLNLRPGTARFGASTLTMQLVRVLEPRPWPRDLRGKLRQALWAARLERAIDKRAILEQYLNRVYYGNGAFGIEAAARRYLGKSASALSAGEAAFLAVLPRGPSFYDPARHLPRALARRTHLLRRMTELGWLPRAEAELALRLPPTLRWQRPGRHAPHFVDHVLNQLPAGQLAGARVRTTLDLRLQERLEIALHRHLDSLGRGVGQAGLLVLRHADGAVLAMIGSRDYDDLAHDGAANVITGRRRPGSTLKPYVYALALEAGDSPATLAHDVVLPGEGHEPYTGDVKQHGFARYREALAGSYNLAAVHALKRVGVQTLVQRLRAAGVASLDRPEGGYDAALAIGEGEFTILQYAGAFAAFGTGGRPVRPRSIVRIERDGAEVARPVPAPLSPVLSPQVAYQVFDMLADPDARRPMFGQEAPVILPFPVALKTGTTRAYTDNLAFGTTAEFTVAAWAGNFDGSPTEAVMAMQGAAPLVRAGFVAIAALHGEPTAPPRPPGLVERAVCPASGQWPGPHCPARKRELFRADALPPEHARCELHVLHAGQVRLALPPELQGWARAHGVPHVARGMGDGAAATVAAEVPLRIVFPVDGARFLLDPHRPAVFQRPPLRALLSGGPTDPRAADVRWTIDGLPVERFRPGPGRHDIEARLGDRRARATIVYE